MGKKIKLSIITPTYQNEDYIRQVVDEIFKDIIKHFKEKCELIIYESGSTDKTREILIKLQKKYPFELIKTPQRVGYINQVKKLYQEAKGDLIFFLDSDGECHPKDFWKLYKKYQNGNFDVVTALRIKRKPIYRLIITKFDNFLIRKLFGSKNHDANCAFRLVKKNIGKKLIENCGHLKHNFNSEQLILAHQAKLKIGELAVIHRPRKSVVSPPGKILCQIFKATYEIIRFKFNHE